MEAGLIPLCVTAKARAAILRETILRRPYEHLSKKMSSDSVPLRIKSHGGGGAKLTSWRDTAIEVSREAGLHNLPREELCPPGSVIRTIPNGRITINNSIPGLSKALPTELSGEKLP